MLQTVTLAEAALMTAFLLSPKAVIQKFGLWKDGTMIFAQICQKIFEPITSALLVAT